MLLSFPAVTEAACKAQGRVLELLYFVTKELGVTSSLAPNGLPGRYLPLHTTQNSTNTRKRSSHVFSRRPLVGRRSARASLLGFCCRPLEFALRFTWRGKNSACYQHPGAPYEHRYDHRHHPLPRLSRRPAQRAMDEHPHLREERADRADASARASLTPFCMTVVYGHSIDTST